MANINIYLGAGRDRKEGFTHVDIYPFPGIDVVADYYGVY